MARVLIVDDDPDFNGLLTDVFLMHEFEVVSKNAPAKALETFKAEPFDVVISDHMMPGCSGSQLMAQCQELNPDVKFIIVSGFLEDETIQKLKEAGVSGLYLKPLNVIELVQKVQGLLA